jgi:hypothetical protein
LGQPLTLQHSGGTTLNRHKDTELQATALFLPINLKPHKISLPTEQINILCTATFTFWSMLILTEMIAIYLKRQCSEGEYYIF